jgi:hypothetical protein
VIGIGFSFLRTKGLVPDDDSSEEMEMEVEW